MLRRHGVQPDSGGVDTEAFGNSTKRSTVTLRVLQQSEDVREGTTAFSEKRVPSYQGR